MVSIAPAAVCDYSQYVLAILFLKLIELFMDKDLK